MIVFVFVLHHNIEYVWKSTLLCHFQSRKGTPNDFQI